MKCLFCGNPLPLGRRKLCSKQCIKRSWYVRSLTLGNQSYYTSTGLPNSTIGKGLYWEKYVAEKLGKREYAWDERADLISLA